MVPCTHSHGREPGKDEIVLPAGERAVIINRASRSAEVDVLTVRLGGEEEYKIPRRLIRHNAMPVRLHFVALLRLEKETLTAPTALGAPVARHVGLSVGGQTPV